MLSEGVYGSISKSSLKPSVHPNQIPNLHSV